MQVITLRMLNKVSGKLVRPMYCRKKLLSVMVDSKKSVSPLEMNISDEELKAASQKGDSQFIKKYIDDLKARGKRCEEKHHILYLTSCFKRSDSKEAVSYLMRSPLHDISDDMCSIGIKTCSIVGDTANMKKVIHFFSSCRRTLPRTVWLDVIKCHAKHGDISSCIRVFRNLQNNKNIVCDVDLYNTLISAHISCGRLEELKDILISMKKNNVIPNNETWKYRMQGARLVNSNKIKLMAYSWLKSLGESNNQPRKNSLLVDETVTEIDIINSIFESLSDFDDVVVTLQVFHRILDYKLFLLLAKAEKVIPSMILVGKKSGNPSSFVRVVTEIARSGLKISHDHWVMMAEVVVGFEDPSTVFLQLMEIFRKSGLQIEAYHWNDLMDTYVRQNKVEEILACMEEMEIIDNIVPSQESFVRFMKCFAHRNVSLDRFDSIFTLHRPLQELRNSSLRVDYFFEQLKRAIAGEKERPGNEAPLISKFVRNRYLGKNENAVNEVVSKFGERLGQEVLRDMSGMKILPGSSGQNV